MYVNIYVFYRLFRCFLSLLFIYVIDWFLGGTFCAGYDLEEISTGNVELSDNGPMVKGHVLFFQTKLLYTFHDCIENHLF